MHNLCFFIIFFKNHFLLKIIFWLLWSIWLPRVHCILVLFTRRNTIFENLRLCSIMVHPPVENSFKDAFVGAGYKCNKSNQCIRVAENSTLHWHMQKGHDNCTGHIPFSDNRHNCPPYSALLPHKHAPQMQTPYSNVHSIYFLESFVYGGTSLKRRKDWI